MKDHPREENYNIADPNITSIDEHEQKLRFAIWDQMEFLSEEIGMDNPKEIIDIIRKSVEDYFLEYSPADESFEEEYED